MAGCAGFDFQEHMRGAMLRLYILFSLSKKRRHGYELLKNFREKMAERRGGRGASVGEIYSILGNLEKAGYIKFEWIGTGRRKKVFSLTAKGTVAVKRAKQDFRRAISLLREFVPALFSGRPAGK